jgi:hypothetical protein
VCHAPLTEATSVQVAAFKLGGTHFSHSAHAVEDKLSERTAYMHYYVAMIMFGTRAATKELQQFGHRSDCLHGRRDAALVLVRRGLHNCKLVVQHCAYDRGAWQCRLRYTKGRTRLVIGRYSLACVV